MISVRVFKTYSKVILKANPFHSSLMRPQLPKPKNSVVVMFSIGANVLESSYLEKTTFLDVGTCLLLILHSTFRKGVNSLWFNVDQFIHFFLKLSASLKAD